MALINCPECGKEISDSVKKCPHCGKKIKDNPFKQFVFKHKILFSLFIVSDFMRCHKIAHIS